MRVSIRLNYIITYLFLVMCMYFLIKCYGRSIIIDTLMDEKETTLYKEANSIAQNYVFDTQSLTTTEKSTASQIRDRFESLQAMSDIRFWLVDNSGRILIDSSTDSGRENYNINTYDDSFLSNQIYTGHLPSKLVSGEILSVIYPLTYNQETNGYLVLLAPVDGLFQKADGYLNDLTICLLIFFALLFVCFTFLAYQTVRPMNIMIKAIQEYTNGNFNDSKEKYPLDIIYSYEYKELADAIDYLAAKIRNTNDYQKKFIANMSHDFRSPLTSIKGYTEAMLDGTIPPEMQEKYLNTILFETKRLSKLTRNLLELNQFENNGMLLELSTFDINHTLKIATSAFEQQCLEKRISIQLIFSQKVLLVDADENRMEQVIQNLVDNAIKFSNCDSTIEVQTMERSGKAFISIKDHGIGIPRNSVPFIWDRFYKSDLSRGKDKTGTGLGLSITKEILDAHKEHINVISTVGAGTEFIFTLHTHSS